VWEARDTRKRFLGSVKSVDETTQLIEVHVWGSYRKDPLHSRVFVPMWRRPQGSRVRYQHQQPPSHFSDICIVSITEIVERQVSLSAEGKLSPVSAAEHASTFSAARTPTPDRVSLDVPPVCLV